VLAKHSAIDRLNSYEHYRANLGCVCSSRDHSENTMSTTLKELMAAANSVVQRLSAREAKDRIDAGNVMILDVRDGSEVGATGKIKGAIHVSRGLLEFKADPDSPSRTPELTPDKTVLIYCGSGGRAALAGKTLKDLGYASVFNIGAFKELAEAGIAVERG
jgi:rhodanese-related sulfurtransferase